MGRRGSAADGIRRFALAAAVVLIGAAAPVGTAVAGDAEARADPETPARLLFGRIDRPSATAPRPIGSYAKGCLAGGRQLEDVGPGFQTMRPSRNRAWGHPELLSFVKKLAADLTAEGHAPVLIGDLSQPRGGPMLSGHASHQIGLDVDIWFRPSPLYRLTWDQRHDWSAYSVVESVRAPWVNDRFTRREARLIELAARDRRTERIFVAAPIKKALCEATPEHRRGWLAKVRPWYGHKDHLHVRLACPAGDVGCKAQAAPPPGDGCGAELASWLTPPPPPADPKPPAKKPKPVKKREITLDQLPTDCASVLDARSRG